MNETNHIKNLPVVARLFSFLISFWPFYYGRGRLRAIMGYLTAHLHGLFWVTLTNHNLPRIRIAIPFPDHSSSLIATFQEQDKPLFKLLKKICTRSPGYFVDIGANLGIYSLRLAKLPGIKSLAFEPQSDLCQLLKKNAEHLFVNDSVLIKNIALGEQQGVVSLLKDPFDSGHARVQLAHDDASSGTVNLKTLDEALHEHPISNISLIKIDAEGYELKILQGAANTLARVQPPLIFELNTAEYSTPSSLLFDQLERYGYKTFFVIDRCIYPLANGVLPICNILALTSQSPVLQWLPVSHSFSPRSTAAWPVTKIVR